MSETRGAILSEHQLQAGGKLQCTRLISRDTRCKIECQGRELGVTSIQKLQDALALLVVDGLSGRLAVAIGEATPLLDISRRLVPVDTVIGATGAAGRAGQLDQETDRLHRHFFRGATTKLTGRIGTVCGTRPTLRLLHPALVGLALHAPVGEQLEARVESLLDDLDAIQR